MGHSLGSMVGQVFAQRYPERINKLDTSKNLALGLAL